MIAVIHQTAEVKNGWQILYINKNLKCLCDNCLQLHESVLLTIYTDLISLCLGVCCLHPLALDGSRNKLCAPHPDHRSSSNTWQNAAVSQSGDEIWTDGIILPFQLCPSLRRFPRRLWRAGEEQHTGAERKERETDHEGRARQRHRDKERVEMWWETEPV